MTGPITPERAKVHASINALTSPPIAFIPLRETCEVIAKHDAHLVRRIADLEAEQAASRDREARLVEALGEALHGLSAMLLLTGALNDDKAHAAYEKVVARFAALAHRSQEGEG